MDVLGRRIRGTLVVLVCDYGKLMGPFWGYFLVGLLATHDIRILLGTFGLEMVGFIIYDFPVSVNVFVEVSVHVGFTRVLLEA